MFAGGARVAWASIRVKLVRGRDGPEVVHAPVWEPVSRSKAQGVDGAATPAVVTGGAVSSNSWIVGSVLSDHIRNGIAEAHRVLSGLDGGKTSPDLALLVCAQDKPVLRVTEWFVSWASCAVQFDSNQVRR